MSGWGTFLMMVSSASSSRGHQPLPGNRPRSCFAVVDHTGVLMLRGPDRLRHAADQDRLHRPCPSHMDQEWLRQVGHHGGAVALHQLHQPLHVPAAIHGQPRIGHRREGRSRNGPANGVRRVPHFSLFLFPFSPHFFSRTLEGAYAPAAPRGAPPKRIGIFLSLGKHP